MAIGGHAYRYAEIGTGPPLLLLHGWTGSWENFATWFDPLAPSFRVIVPDLPGCAGAPRLDGPHTALGYAAFCHELVVALGQGPATVGGLCSGAAIGMAFAARYPDDVAALLLHTPLYHREVLHPTFRAQLRVFGLPIAGPLVDRLRRDRRLTALYRRIFTNGGEVRSEDDAVNQRNLERADAAAARELLLDIARGDHRALLREWRKPLFVVVAAADAFIRPDAVGLVRALAPDARIAVIEGGGHGWTPAYLRRQDEVLAEFAAFAREAG